jgi:hypothetical protein
MLVTLAVGMLLTVTVVMLLTVTVVTRYDGPPGRHSRRSVFSQCSLSVLSVFSKVSVFDHSVVYASLV